MDMRYRKVVQEEFVDAVKWTGKNIDEIKELVGNEKKVRFDAGGRMYVGNFQTYIPVEVGEFVVMRSSKINRGERFIAKLSQEMMDIGYEPASATQPLVNSLITNAGLE